LPLNGHSDTGGIAMKQRYCVAYARTSYMEVEVEAESHSAAEAIFERLATMKPSPCEEGQQLAPSLYRVIDIGPIETASRSELVAQAA
jgi:hypothetical protein